MTGQDAVDRMAALQGRLDAAWLTGQPCEALLDELDAAVNEQRARGFAARLAAAAEVTA